MSVEEMIFYVNGNYTKSFKWTKYPAPLKTFDYMYLFKIERKLQLIYDEINRFCFRKGLPVIPDQVKMAIVFLTPVLLMFLIIKFVCC